MTGQVVPEDELVLLNGKRVCAEGKAILLEQMKAGEAPGETERPSDIRRFGCMILDNIILGVPFLILNFAVVGVAAAGSTAGVDLTAGAIQLINSFVAVAYFTLMHGTRSQTLGKMAGKLKVVRMDGLPMDMTTAFIRALAYTGINLIPAILIFFSLSAIVTIGINGMIVIYAFVNAIMALVDRANQRTLHDRIAGTRVVTAG